MSKSATAGMKTSIALRDMSHVFCWSVETEVGAFQGFTELDDDLFVDLADGNGFRTYADISGFTRSSITNTDTLAVDNLDVIGFLDPDVFDRNDIIAGVYDGATVRMFLVNFNDLTQGVVKFRRATIGNVSMFEGRFEAELRGMLQRYTQEIVGVATVLCRADLGDLPGFSPSIRGCKVQVDPPFWAPSTAYTERPPRDAGLGSVVKPLDYNDRYFEVKVGGGGTSGGSEPSWNLTIDGETTDGGVTWITKQALTVIATIDVVTNRGKFTIIYTGDAPDALLKGGLLFIKTGKNAKLFPLDVKTWDLTGKEIVLYLPAGFDLMDTTSTLELEDGTGTLLLEDGSGSLLMEAGETIHIRAGCAKDVPACRDTYRNITNARFEPHVPGAKVIQRTAAALFSAGGTT